MRSLSKKVKNYCSQEFDQEQAPLAPGVEEQSQALFNFPLPIENEQALFGDDIEVTPIDRYSAYVNPSMYAVHQQQCIERWDTVNNFAFAGMGTTYIKSLSLHSTQQRPFELCGSARTELKV